MARNKYTGVCYICGLIVRPGTGHFERKGRAWLTKHVSAEE